MKFSKVARALLLNLLAISGIAGAYGQRAINQNAVLFAGNAFYWSNPATDTITEEDSETGEFVTKIVHYESAIALMNKDTVYNSDGYKNTVPPLFKHNGQNAAQYLSALFKGNKDYKGAPSFSIRKMVINKAGKVVFFEIVFDDYTNAKMLKDKWKEPVEDAIKRMPAWEPGTYNNKAVAFYLFEEIPVKP